MSLFGSIFPVGAMLGPIFGGLIVSYWSWRGIFFVNVPIGVAIAILAMHFIPPDRVRDATRGSGDGPHRTGSTRASGHGTTDVLGIALLTAGLLGAMLATSYLGEPQSRIASPLFLVTAVVGVVAIWAFFRHLGRTAHPFIEPRFIKGAGFGAVNLVNAVYSGIQLGVIALVPLYAANRYGIGALSAGTLLIAEGAAAVVLSISAAMALRWTGHRPPIYVGASATILGIVILSLAPPGGFSPYWWLACGTFVIGAGSGVMNPASRNAGLQLAPRSSSTLAALRTMSLQAGQITTVSVVTAILASAASPGVTQAWINIALAAVLVLCLPVIHRVPEHHGKW